MTGRDYRIIVTGSRNWSGQVRRAMMRREIRIAIDEAIAKGWRRDAIVIVTGDAKGADRMALALSHELRVEQEMHRADWEMRGRAAGPVRNEEMARAGAMLCLAFPLAGSPGTRDMVRRAEKHGIPVRMRGEVPTGWGID